MLDDLDSDGLLDVVVWGMMENNNCLQPFIQTKSGSFVAGQVLTMQVTSNPFVISYGINNAEKSTALLTFVNGSRTILKY
jgi:hypothetical protein